MFLKKKRSVAVTALAEVAVCQRRVYLRSRLGERLTREQVKRRELGNQLHARAYRQANPASDSRCFIATEIFGQDSHETNRLRLFRDRSLIPFAMGRWMVANYYRVSPDLAALLRRNRLAKKAMRAVLRALLWMIG